MDLHQLSRLFTVMLIAAAAALFSGCDDPSQTSSTTPAVAPPPPPPPPPSVVPSDNPPVVGGGTNNNGNVTTTIPAVENDNVSPTLDKLPDYPSKTDWGIVADRVEIPSSDRPALVYAAHGQPFVALDNAVYDVNTGKPAGKIGVEWKQSSAKYALSPGGKILATCYRDRELKTQVIQFVDCVTGGILHVMPIKRDETSVLTTTMEFIDDERIAWLGRVSGKQGLLIFNVADAEMVSAIEIPTSSTLTGAMSPNGQHFAVTDTKGLVIYDLEEGKPAAQLPRPPDREGINLGFNNCRELTFAPDGEQLAGLFSVRDGSRLVVWNGMTEIVVDEIIPRVSAPGFNPVDVLQWASDQSGWLIGHRHYYSRSARRVVWTLGVQNLAQPPIKFVGEDRLLTFSRKGRNKVGLVELHVPRKEIRSAVAALESGEAILKPGDAVSLDIRVGAVRFASKQEVLDDLTNTLTERFRQEGFVVAPGATNVFSVEYSESAGAVTQIVEQDQFGRPAKTVGTTQQTETSLHARFTAQNGQTVLWEKKSDGKSFNYGQVSSTDPKDLRKSRYNGAKSAIAGGWRPYFVSTREDVPQLPLLTQP